MSKAVYVHEFTHTYIFNLSQKHGRTSGVATAQWQQDGKHA
jgi:hypothetical protein